MPLEQLANNGPTNTSSATYSTVATSIVMNSVSGYPSLPQFRLLNVRTSELVLVTALAGTTLTVTRGAEGSSTQTINTGDAFTHILTAGALVSLVDAPLQDLIVTAGSTTFTISGLDLNTDKQYEIEFAGVWSGSFANTTAIVIWPNGSSPSNVNGIAHRAYTSTQDMGSTPYSSIFVLQSDFAVGTGGIEIWFRLRLRLSATNRKHFEIDSYFISSATQLLWSKNVLIWHDTTTNVTSLQLHPNAGTLSGTVKVRLVR